MTIRGTLLTRMGNANGNQAKSAKLNFNHADSTEKDKKTDKKNGAVIQASAQSRFDKMIENIRERIQKVNANEQYDEKTKQEKVKELQKQLEELEKAKASQLSESLLEKEKKAEKNSANNNSVANTQKSTNLYGDTLEVSLDAKALLQADSGLKNLESARSTKVKSEGDARVLTSEIEIDRERGVDTTKKEEELEKVNATTENSISDMGEAIGDINKAAQNISENADPTAATRNESQVSEEEKTSDTVSANTENATEGQRPQVKVAEEK